LKLIRVTGSNPVQLTANIKGLAEKR